MSGQSPQITRTMEEYLQAIYYLSKDGRPVIAARLASWLNVAAPSVTAMLQRMRRDGLLEAASQRELKLTPEGQAAAVSIARRHYLAERLLTDLLGLSWAVSHAEADRWEHAITPETEARLLEVLGRPQTCPHGSPIPGTGGRVSPNAFSLAESEPGERVVVSHIAEAAEENSDLLAFLERQGITPNTWLEVREHTRVNGTITVRTSGGSTVLGREVATQIFVLPEHLAHEAPKRSRPLLRRMDRLAGAARRRVSSVRFRPPRGSAGQRAARGTAGHDPLPFRYD